MKHLMTALILSLATVLANAAPVALVPGSRVAPPPATRVGEVTAPLRAQTPAERARLSELAITARAVETRETQVRQTLQSSVSIEALATRMYEDSTCSVVCQGITAAVRNHALVGNNAQAIANVEAMTREAEALLPTTGSFEVAMVTVAQRRGISPEAVRNNCGAR